LFVEKGIFAREEFLKIGGGGKSGDEKNGEIRYNYRHRF
jgi:hypothetical protein